MTLWQTTTADTRFRMDDRFGSKQLELSPQTDRGTGGIIVRVDVPGLRCEEERCGEPVDATVGVPVLEVLAALQGMGVKPSLVASVFGLETERDLLVKTLEEVGDVLQRLHASSDEEKPGPALASSEIDDVLAKAGVLLGKVRAR